MDIFILFPLHDLDVRIPLAARLRQLSLQGITLFYGDFQLFLQTTGTIFFPKFSKKKARHREISLVQGQRDNSAMEGIGS